LFCCNIATKIYNFTLEIAAIYDKGDKESISDKELLSQFQKVSLLSNDRKAFVKELLEAFLLKSDL
jgi:hypothetical protein